MVMGAAGKTVEVLEGRSMRPSSAKKARNNKVYTTKGPRDRRVRLSADTAIQFYDVQDRLGCERASEAIDWLIEKAKGSIDKLYGASPQQFEHHFDHPGEQYRENLQGGYVAESSMFQNIIMADSSTVYPLAQLANEGAKGGVPLSTFGVCRLAHPSANYKKLEDTYFSSTNPTSSRTLLMKHGQYNSSIEENHDELVSNSVPCSFLKALIQGQNYDLSSGHTGNDLNSTECLSDENEASVRDSLSDEVACLSSSIPDRQYQEDFEGFSQPIGEAGFWRTG